MLVSESPRVSIAGSEKADSMIPGEAIERMPSDVRGFDGFNSQENGGSQVAASSD